MKTIPTAEELLYNTLLEGIIDRRGKDGDGIKPEIYAYNLSSPILHPILQEKQPHDTVIAMIEFAKLHVKAALEAAANQKSYGMLSIPLFHEINKEAILKAYPDTNIK